MSGLEMLWNWRAKRIEFLYDTDYISVKERSVSPLFFDIHLKPKVKVEHANLKMKIMLEREIQTKDGTLNLWRESTEHFFTHLKNIVESI